MSEAIAFGVAPMRRLPYLRQSIDIRHGSIIYGQPCRRLAVSTRRRNVLHWVDTASGCVPSSEQYCMLAIAGKHGLGRET